MAQKDVMRTSLSGILLFSVLLYSFQITQLTPGGYRVDIYSELGYKLIAEFITIFALSQILFTTAKRPYRWLSLGVLLGVWMSFVLSPYLMGYYVSDRGDSLQSVGYIRTILTTSHTDPRDIYPTQWIFLGSVQRIVGLSVQDIVVLASVLNNGMFILALLLFVRRFGSEIIAYFVPAFLLTFYHGTIIAEFFAYSLLTILVYFLIVVHRSQSNKDFRWSVVITVFLVTLVFSHPFVAFFCLGMLGFLVLSSTIEAKGSGFYSRLFGLYAIVLLGWLAWQRILTRTLFLVPVFLRKMVIIKQVSYATSTSGVGIVELLKYFLIRFWGQLVLYSVVMLIGFYLVLSLKRWKVHGGYNRSLGEGFLSLWSIIFTGILLLQKHGYDRVLGLNFMIIGAVIVLSMIWNLVGLSWTEPVRIMLVFILPFSVFSVFYSPINGMAYTGITYGELSGIVFSFSHLTSGLRVIDPLGEAGRWSAWLFGYSETFKRQEVLYSYRLPDHFGYPSVDCFSKNKYIQKIAHNLFGYQKLRVYPYPKLVVVIPDYPIQLYEEAPLFKRVRRFTHLDEQRLRADYSVNLIYHGSSLRVYRPIPCTG